MRIPNIKPIQLSTKQILKRTVLCGIGLLAMQPTGAIENSNKDCFISTTKSAPTDSTKISNVINSIEIPSPQIKIGNKIQTAAIVVDISQNKLFHYDSNGILSNIYPVATGKPSTPTHKGIRKVINIESYPYSSARGTKRRRNPSDYGPKAVILGIVDTATGDIVGNNGEFLHGTNNPSSIGKYASKGCIRMHNDAIKKLSAELEKGQYILIK